MVGHVADIRAQTLMAGGDQVCSWMIGARIESHQPRALIYFGGANVYCDRLRESVDAGLPQLEFGKLAGCVVIPAASAEVSSAIARGAARC